MIYITCFLLFSYSHHISVIVIFTFPIFTCLLILIVFISSFHFSNYLSPYEFSQSLKIPVDHAWNLFLTSKSKQSPRPTTLLLHTPYRMSFPIGATNSSYHNLLTILTASLMYSWSLDLISSNPLSTRESPSCLKLFSGAPFPSG